MLPIGIIKDHCLHRGSELTRHKPFCLFINFRQIFISYDFILCITDQILQSIQTFFIRIIVWIVVAVYLWLFCGTTCLDVRFNVGRPFFRYKTHAKHIYRTKMCVFYSSFYDYSVQKIEFSYSRCVLRSWFGRSHSLRCGYLYQTNAYDYIKLKIFGFCAFFVCSMSWLPVLMLMLPLI